MKEALSRIDAPKWGGTWYAIGRAQTALSEAIEISRKEEEAFGDGR